MTSDRLRTIEEVIEYCKNTIEIDSQLIRRTGHRLFLHQQTRGHRTALANLLERLTQD